MANAQKYTRAACGHLAAHYERRKDEKGRICEVWQSRYRPTKTHLNYNLAPRRGVEQIDFIRQRTTEARTLKRDDVNVMCSWVVTLPEYRHHNKNLHVSPDKEQVERLFFERSIVFSATATESRMSYRRMSIRKKTPHMLLLVPVTEDRSVVAKRFQLKRSSQRMTLRPFTRTWNATSTASEIGTLRWSMKPPRTAIRRLLN